MQTLITNKKIKIYFYKKYFYNFEFFSCKYVYGPKYETEYIIYLFQQILLKDKNINSIYDVCSGTGCIGITLKKLYKSKNISLIDKNKYAIQCINKNLKLHNLNTDIIHNDVFNMELKADVIVCNPPYIKTKNIKENTLNEISVSLDGGENGINFTLKLFQISQNIKYIILELGSKEQMNDIINTEKILNKWNCIEKIKPYENIEICFCVFKNKLI